MRRLILLTLLTVGLGWIGVAPATAHSELVSSTPAAGASLDNAPTDVRLVFNQDINSLFATVSLVGSGNEQWAEGDTTVDGPDVTVQVRDGLPAGQYTVGYRVTSADGHPITGAYDFSVSELAVATSAPSSQTASDPISSTPTTAAPAYDPRDPRASEGEREPKQNTTMLLSAIAIAVVGLGAIAATLMIRAKKRD